ncbi:hypothetical protein [Marinirhabdus gelatinilytica]|uniref:REase AHJR-like domain-containing protein n=1 Tax=Marinirhabdus gelatinilytica TaxID=1703343 RepID=A0A370Q343_9FLAO|nr:hypothetical protein [Marinirhabdus gelatinilytica]RDK82774.1 hypothetical protein C8D94_1133 [Marinirhabdus gelatinilytica]
MERTNNIPREQRKIKELAREYEEKGFQVFIEPERNLLPDFLKDYHPDLILKKGELNIVVEVKTSETIKNSQYLKELSAKINSLENWKFELVITNPRVKDNLINNKFQEFSLIEIENRLNKVSNSIDKNFLEPYFLYAWSLFEASSRAILKADQPKAERKLNPTANIKQLYSYGIIGRIDYEWLNKISQIRNHIVHGHSIQKSEIKEKDLNKLIRMTEDFIKEIK